MATFIELAAHWAGQLKTSGAEAAILFQAGAPQAYALSGANPSSTAIVNLLQSSFIPKDRWMAASYPPTAACIGMAHLLKLKRIVWANASGTFCSVSLGETPAKTEGAPAKACQFDKTVHALSAPPAIMRAFPNYTHSRGNVFVPPVDAASIVSDLQGADAVVKDNACTLLALAIANVAHGPLDNSARAPSYQGQNIASILVDSNYTILRWGLNTNKVHTTLHGEINLIRSYGKALPIGGKLFTTLEPCAMCSGMIVHCATGAFSVVSAQSDPHVHYSALKKPEGTDGYSTSARNVDSTIAKLPLAPVPAGVRTDKRFFDTFDSNLARAQVQQSGGASSRLMQTTKFLESAKPVMNDGFIMLDKMAAMWIPSNARDAWRQKVRNLLNYVKTSVAS
jgi:tRNA(Arg) A34 adenosine deaminase TadA